MSKKKLRTSEDYESQCKEICKIVEFSSIQKSHLESNLEKLPNDEMLNALYQEFCSINIAAKSIRYHLFSTGRVPYRAKQRMQTSLEKVNALIVWLTRV